MSKRKCVRCGKDPAEGFASSWTQETGERFYCHGDDDDVSCYESREWTDTPPGVAALRPLQFRSEVWTRDDD